MKVTPWEVSGHIDYDRLVKEFGTKHLTPKILKRVEKYAPLHLFLRRKLFFSHRDFDWILDKYESGEKFALYTGRGPSGHTHLGHLMPWIFTKWLQDTFDCELYFQLTDDEKFLRDDLSLDETHNYAKENALDVIAIGFDPSKTKIFSDLNSAKTLYKTALKVAKLTTFSTAKAVFGFDNSTNIGMAFFPAIQAAPCFLPSEIKKKKVPVLIPAAIDQDPYWRISRDVADRLGYYKPAQIHCMFLPGLEGPDSKMSASRPDSAIFTNDTPEAARRKIMKAFSGGARNLEEHKKHGGNPDVDTACQYLYYLFEEDDGKIKEIFDSYRKGSMTSGEVKKLLANKVVAFLKEHKSRREKARKNIEHFMVED